MKTESNDLNYTRLINLLRANADPVVLHTGNPINMNIQSHISTLDFMLNTHLKSQTLL